MARKLLILLLLPAIAACASNSLPQAEGPWHPLNAGKWSFQDNALTQPPAGFTR